MFVLSVHASDQPHRSRPAAVDEVQRGDGSLASAVNEDYTVKIRRHG
jgi:hypothetical protein